MKRRSTVCLMLWAVLFARIPSGFGDDGIKIRTALASVSGHSVLHVRAAGPLTLRIGEQAYEIPDRETLEVSCESGRLTVAFPGGRETAERFSLVRRREGPGSGFRIAEGWIPEAVHAGDSVWKAAGEGILPVVGLDLETYVAGTLQYEMDAGWPLEARKAQAVLIRTYALRKALFSFPEYDVSDTAPERVYLGLAGQPDEAVAGTAGLIGISGRDFLPTLYTRSNGGMIAQPDPAWAETGEIGLRTGEDPYDLRNPLSGEREGHGAGMSQRGAEQMAKEGKSAEDILRFYYPDARIVSVPALGDGQAEEDIGGRANAAGDAAPNCPQLLVRIGENQVLRVRRSPSPAAEAVAYLRGGSSVRELRRLGEWSLIRTGSVSGFVRNDYLRNEAADPPGTDSGIPLPDEPGPETPGANGTGRFRTGTVKAWNGLNLRREPLIGDNILEVIPNGAEVEILEEADGFYRIRWRGNEGYASRDYIGPLAGEQ